VSSTRPTSLANGLTNHFTVGAAHISKCIDAARAAKRSQSARINAPQVRDGYSSGLPGKSADCAGTRSRRVCELFVVEGESAGGSAKMGRDRKYQAILPLKGKILNVEKARYTTRCSATKKFAPSSRRWATGIGKDDFGCRKIALSQNYSMTDADVDGSHIRTFRTFFFRHMKELSSAAHLLAQPPLYRVKRGKTGKYIRDERDSRAS